MRETRTEPEGIIAPRKNLTFSEVDELMHLVRKRLSFEVDMFFIKM